jgi:hypothetical protein
MKLSRHLIISTMTKEEKEVIVREEEGHMKRKGSNRGRTAYLRVLDFLLRVTSDHWMRIQCQMISRLVCFLLLCLPYLVRYDLI